MIAVIAIAPAACSDALVFADRSSIEVASVRLNDDVAEPIRVNIGFDRQLVTNAPALGGTIEATNEHGDKVKAANGEAINLFSTFRAKVEPEIVGGEPTSTNQLKVHTRFASGAAATAIAGKPEVVAHFLGLQEIRPLSTEMAALQAKLTKCLNVAESTASPPSALDQMATTIGVTPGPGVSSRITDRIRLIGNQQAYSDIAQQMQPFCAQEDLT